ncbi:MAG: putative Phospholipase A-2-activating protein, partial [Streblomastix strix]
EHISNAVLYSICSVGKIDNKQIVAVGSEDRSVAIFDLEAFTKRAVLIHPKSVTCVSTFSNGDIITACYDGGIRIWSNDPKRKQGNEDLMKQHEEELQLIKIKGLLLLQYPTIEQLNNITIGNKDGEIRIVRKGIFPQSYRWEEASQQWILLGDLIEGGEGYAHQNETGRYLVEGAEYDFKIPIDVGEGKSDQLCFNINSNDWEVANDFQEKHHMGSENIPQISKFIQKYKETANQIREARAESNPEMQQFIRMQEQDNKIAVPNRPVVKIRGFKLPLFKARISIIVSCGFGEGSSIPNKISSTRIISNLFVQQNSFIALYNLQQQQNKDKEKEEQEQDQSDEHSVISDILADLSHFSQNDNGNLRISIATFLFNLVVSARVNKKTLGNNIIAMSLILQDLLNTQLEVESNDVAIYCIKTLIILIEDAEQKEAILDVTKLQEAIIRCTEVEREEVRNLALIFCYEAIH